MQNLNFSILEWVLKPVVGQQKFRSEQGYTIQIEAPLVVTSDPRSRNIIEIKAD